MNRGGGNSRKRPPPSNTPPPVKHRATANSTPSPAIGTLEDDFMVEEDVFLDEALLYGDEDEESLILRDIEERESRSSAWARPPLSPAYLSNSQSIIFQQLEIDSIISESHKELLPASSGQAPIIRMFGVTKEGNSVCCFVHGFEPYFYIACPPGMGPDDISNFHQTLEGRMRESNKNAKVPKFVRRIEMVQKRSIMYYQQQKSQTFLKITVALPTMVASCRGILDRGLQIDGLGMKSFQTYESNILFVLRFMVDCDIVGGNWIEVPTGKYKKNARTLSYCQLEFHCLYSDLISHAAEGEYSKMAPFRVLSFDIECAGRKGHFPEAKHDPVIQDLIRDVDPDIIIGYNICKFDLPYLIERAATLGIDEFPLLGRVKNSRVRVRDSTFSSRQQGIRESKETTIEGRFQFDLIQAIHRDHKLSSYSLNSVSAHFLSEQKEDVHHSIITDLQNGNAETRRRLAVYCLKDAYLPQRLLDKLMFIYNYVEMARVTGVPISFLLARGQSIKVLSQLLRKAKQRNMVLPNAKQSGSEQGTYEGATVLEARTGFYEKPIATLDFASLYPSIMMAYNLCYCTLVTPEDVRKLNLLPEHVTKTPSGETFVKQSLQKGILPEILEELLTARKRAKADLKEAKDPLEKAVLDGRQLALKISANSVYGFTGATIGQLPCLEISSSVTSYGREMIEQTKKLVEDKFTTLGGYEHNAEVIYGDTDSVMVQFGVPDVETAMTLGREAAEHISGTFIKPIKLEFEKVYFPYLLINKKRYAGLLWTNPQKFDKMDTKGIETVRRDNCLLVKNLVTESLNKILIDRDVPGAAEFVKKTISDLLMNRIDLSLLVITKGLTKAGDDYEVKSAHGELAERMRKRDAATAPNVGDRVPYVIIKAAKGAKAYERSEDPIYVLQNNIPIDPNYYLENQISKPLLRIFEPVLKNASKELLHGSHTRSISITTPSNSGIMKFAKKQLSCVGCKVPISNGTLCASCKGREAELYCKNVSHVADLEEVFGRLWTQCQECQGSLHQDVLCTSRDCPIFYRRMKAQKDMAVARQQLDRWSF
ncbi:DNA polymerase delta catalytic subunit isoform X2 [Capsella rubella]|uniref:DNA polymerase delta catalytic subunit isoform X2 n=1 Tax=Capsella rubella TaxID=81985 RepID=UPI000CD5AF81|nr:DNA polymerase delta catalytic subunit isoform X2 [Capsella rubella]